MKNTLTAKQIDMIIFNGKMAMRKALESKDNSATSDFYKKMDEFLNLCFDFFIIDDYNDITKIKKQLGEAMLQEYNERKAV